MKSVHALLKIAGELTARGCNNLRAVCAEVEVNAMLLSCSLGVS